MTRPIDPTREDVVNALGRSQKFAEGSDAFNAISPHIGQLIEIVGPRMHDQISLSGLCDVTSTFMSWLASNDEFLSNLDELMERPMLVMLYNNLAGQLNAIATHTEQFLSDQGMTEMQALESATMPESAKELLRRGELSYAALLTTAPETFLPTGS